jgi:GH24 family phage-related lysozyme (muramidase)
MGLFNTSQTQSSQQNAPTAFAGQQYTNAINQAANIANNTPYNPATNVSVAGFTQPQNAAFSQLQGIQGLQSPYLNAATNYANMAADPQNIRGMVSQYMNPYEQNVINSTMTSLNNQYGIQDAQLLGTNAASGNVSSGDRGDVAKALLGGQQAAQTAGTLGGLYNQDYSQALTAAMQNAGMQGQAAYTMGNLGQEAVGLGIQGAQAGLAAGNQQQALQQAQLNAGTQNAVQQTMWPYQNTQYLASILGGLGPLLGGTSSGSSQTQQPLSTSMGLGAMGLGLLFSDERLKEDIQPIGKTFDGLTIHKFRYKGDPTPHVGMLAQEVEKKHPEAVATVNGYKAVDYDAATKDAAKHKSKAAGGAVRGYEDGGSVMPYDTGSPYHPISFPGQLNPANVAKAFSQMQAPSQGAAQQGSALSAVPQMYQLGSTIGGSGGLLGSASNAIGNAYFDPGAFSMADGGAVRGYADGGEPVYGVATDLPFPVGTLPQISAANAFPGLQSQGQGQQGSSALGSAGSMYKMGTSIGGSGGLIGGLGGLLGLAGGGAVHGYADGGALDLPGSVGVAAPSTSSYNPWALTGGIGPQQAAPVVAPQIFNPNAALSMLPAGVAPVPAGQPGGMPAVGPAQAPNAPTYVQSEQYAPDGTRIDTGQPAAPPAQPPQNQPGAQQPPRPRFSYLNDPNPGQPTPGILSPESKAVLREHEAKQADSGHNRAIDFLKSAEDYRGTPYGDYRQTSIGYGSKARPGETFLSREDAEKRLVEDAKPVRQYLDKNVKVPLTQNQRAALTSFGYNLGTGQGGLSDLIPDVNKGDWRAVADRMGRYIHVRDPQTGDMKELPGLIQRRSNEISLLMRPDSEPFTYSQGPAIAGSPDAGARNANATTGAGAESSTALAPDVERIIRRISQPRPENAGLLGALGVKIPAGLNPVQNATFMAALGGLANNPHLAGVALTDQQQQQNTLQAINAAHQYQEMERQNRLATAEIAQKAADVKLKQMQEQKPFLIRTETHKNPFGTYDQYHYYGVHDPDAPGGMREIGPVKGGVQATSPAAPATPDQTVPSKGVDLGQKAPIATETGFIPASITPVADKEKEEPSNLHEEAIANESPEAQALILGIHNGTINPARIKGPQYTWLVGKVKEYDPSFDVGNAEAKFKFRQQYLASYGRTAKDNIAFDTAIDHWLHVIDPATEALPDFRLDFASNTANALAINRMRGKNDPNILGLDSGLQFFSGEASKAGHGGSSVMEHEAIKKDLDPSHGKMGMRAKGATYLGLLVGKNEALMRNWRRVMGNTPFPDGEISLMSPETLDAIDSLLAKYKAEGVPNVEENFWAGVGKNLPGAHAHDKESKSEDQSRSAGPKSGPAPEKTPSAPSPSEQAIAALRAQPSRATEFNKKYGTAEEPNPSSRYLKQ